MGSAENYNGLHRTDRKGVRYQFGRAFNRETHAQMDTERQDTCICRHCVYFGSHRKTPKLDRLMEETA